MALSLMLSLLPHSLGSLCADGDAIFRGGPFLSSSVIIATMSDQAQQAPTNGAGLRYRLLRDVPGLHLALQAALANMGARRPPRPLVRRCSRIRGPFLRHRDASVARPRLRRAIRPIVGTIVSIMWGSALGAFLSPRPTIRRLPFQIDRAPSGPCTQSAVVHFANFATNATGVADWTRRKLADTPAGPQSASPQRATK